MTTRPVRPAHRGARRDTPRALRAGFSLVELVVSMTILLVVLAVCVNVLRRQSSFMANQSGRADAEQSARFAIASLERELRMAGAGVVNGQPMLVAATPTSIVFNVDLVSRTPGDVGAVIVDQDADTGTVGVFRQAQAIVLPGTTNTYPETTYMKSPGVESGAETIAYYLAPDSTSARPNEYILFRRVNAAPPQVMVRNVLHTTADTVFQYFKTDTAGNLSAVPGTSLPLFHAAAIHGSPADTGVYATVDSIRTVRTMLTVVDHDPRSGDIPRTVTSRLRILNAGLAAQLTCGDPPIGVSPAATPSLPGDSVPHVTITWNASVDEHAGQKSVERYILYRRPAAAAAFTEAFATIPAGNTAYTYTDTDVRSGESWIYGVSAQDCTPSNSAIGATFAVTVP